jgi:hypothetical protein
MKAIKNTKVQSRSSAAVSATAAKLAKVEKQTTKLRLPTDPYERTCLVTLQKGGNVNMLAKEVAAQFTKDTRKPWRAKPAFFVAWAHDYLEELKFHGITPKITGKFPKEEPTVVQLARLKGEENPLKTAQVYKPSNLVVKLKEQSPSKWEFGGGIITGTEFFYEAKDENFAHLNRWTFRVQIPDDAYGDIIVQPVKTPARSVWTVLGRRSIVFPRATKAGYKSFAYCKINLADPSGHKNKTGTRRGDRADFPQWFEKFSRRMRLKKTITTTRANDYNAQVIVAKRDDHRFMIEIFFALKVWVMEEGFKLPRN